MIGKIGEIVEKKQKLTAKKTNELNLIVEMQRFTKGGSAADVLV